MNVTRLAEWHENPPQKKKKKKKTRQRGARLSTDDDEPDIITPCHYIISHAITPLRAIIILMTLRCHYFRHFHATFSLHDTLANIIDIPTLILYTLMPLLTLLLFSPFSPIIIIIFTHIIITIIFHYYYYASQTICH
jgi:hypothetical protein